MLPRKVPSGVDHTDSLFFHSDDDVAEISLAQECTEASNWLQQSCSCNDFTCSYCRQLSAVNEARSVGNGSGEFVRVGLSKSPYRDAQPRQFFVRAGGMSIPVPASPPKSRMSGENNQHQVKPPAACAVPELDNGSLEILRYDEAEEISGNTGKKSTSFLPLSVELVGGRGTTSMPADGNKNSSGSVKEKSVPPSRTLAMSASIFKNYLIPSNDKTQSKNSSSMPDPENSVKTKMIGIWNNVKYGWTVNLKTNFSRDSPVHLLSSVYHKSSGETDEDASERIDENGMEAFKRHFYSLIWCTYRRQFPMLQDSTLTTDCGWGCMLRSGQMMVSHALVLHFLSSRWRHVKHMSDGPEERIHQRIVQWMGDSPSPQCPLSLHNLVHLGNRLGKKAGDWYGPASVAYIFKEAIEMGSKYIKDLQRLCVYVAQDCAVYIQDVLDMTMCKCICNKGDLIKLSEVAKVKEKNTSEYLEKIKNSSVTQRVSEARVPLENGSNVGIDERRRDSPTANSSSSSVKELSERTLSRQSSEISTDRTKTDENIQSCAKNRSKLSNSKTINKSEEEPFISCSKCENWKSLIIMVPVRLGGETLNPIYASCVCDLFTHDLCIGIIGGRPKHSLYFVGFQDEHLIHLDPHLCQDAVVVTQPNFPISSYHCSSPRKMALSRMDPSATFGFYCHTRTDFLRLMEELPQILTPKEPGYEYPIFEFVDGKSEDADALARQLTDEDQMAATLPRDTPLLPQDSEEFVFI